MITIEPIVAKLARRYPHLEHVADAVFRGVDTYEDRPYAIRYFDLTNDLLSAAGRLHEYQDKLLGVSYFNREAKADLRWNYYLYFIMGRQPVDAAFLKAKATVESDREYARKLVLTERELDQLLDEPRFGDDSSAALPPDALTIWTEALEKYNLGFVVDETLQVPTIVRHITEGERQPVLRPPATPQLEPSERAASTDFLTSIAIHGFRTYPIQKTFDFGAVNLILGVNGVGKTSLLEAIEYLFCGKTRRAGSVLPRTSVSAVLAQSKLVLETKGTTSQGALRARHLAWYGKSELRTLTLHDSFSKFNFLDTDAAVRLTVEKSRERIIEDLSQLLLGAEASKAIDRFERVNRQLADNKRTLESNIAVRDLRRSEAAAKIQLLRNAPRDSEPLFSDLLGILRAAGWRQVPNEKNEVERLAASVQSALLNIAVLKSGDAGNPSAKDLHDLDAVIKALVETERALDDMAKDELARKRNAINTSVQLQELAKRNDALDALAPIVSAGINELHHRRQVLERQLSDGTSALVEAEGALASAPSSEQHRKKMLSQAVKEWTEFVEVASKRIDAAKKALGAFELSQNLLVSLRQRLRSTAREIIHRTEDSAHCPLCGAHYSEAELGEKLERVALGVETGESDRIRSELQDAEFVHKERVSELAALRALERYVADPNRTSLGAAGRLVNRARKQLARMATELEAVRNTLRVHEQEGWTIDRLIQLTSAAGIDESAITPEVISAAQDTIRHERTRLLETVKEQEAAAQEAQSYLAEVRVAYGLETETAAEAAQTIAVRKRLAEDKRRAVTALEGQVNLATTSSLSELDVRLREAQKLIVRLRTVVAQEQQDSNVIQQESKAVDDAVAEIEGLRVKLRRIDSAQAVLRDLLSKQSERLLTETVLRQNAAKIASTFAKIHAPNEFDLVVNGGMTIVRRGGGNVELDEMSSGQRAAYALSLFLAMNERLRAGPRVLLFDDPVAHVDDINTLSLLDHLRDVALTGQRQIFFATADSKIGALFGRKFSFLGDRFKQIDLTRE